MPRLVNEFRPSFLVEEPDTTAGLLPLMFGLGTTTGASPCSDPALGLSERLSYRTPALTVRVVLRESLLDWDEDEPVPTSGWALWPFVSSGASTGESVREIAQTIHDAWRGRLGALGVADSIAPMRASAAVLVDVPSALKAARRQAGLPVQDLAAMVGIRRRQFYNLVSGEQNTDDDRAPRIAHITDVIGHVSHLMGGNSRRTRQFLLARLDGDSIYDASVADDDDRVRLAVDRATDAFHRGRSLGHQLPPSARATPQEAAAVREYLRASRDASGDTDA
jgi:hypothetical protein